MKNWEIILKTLIKYGKVDIASLISNDYFTYNPDESLSKYEIDDNAKITTLKYDNEITEYQISFNDLKNMKLSNSDVYELVTSNSKVIELKKIYTP